MKGEYAYFLGSWFHRNRCAATDTRSDFARSSIENFGFPPDLFRKKGALS
jgi:hypothetical protein